MLIAWAESQDRHCHLPHSPFGVCLTEPHSLSKHLESSYTLVDGGLSTPFTELLSICASDRIETILGSWSPIAGTFSAIELGPDMSLPEAGGKCYVSVRKRRLG